jgi:hypothetical protein
VRQWFDFIDHDMPAQDQRLQMDAWLVEYRRVFTTVAIILVAIIMWLLIDVAFPAYIRGWNLSRARRIISDASEMDNAIDQWATESGKQEGDEINTIDAAAYLKSGSWHESDIVGNQYVVGVIGTKQITVSASTKALLVGPSIDWGSY